MSGLSYWIIRIPKVRSMLSRALTSMKGGEGNPGKEQKVGDRRQETNRKRQVLASSGQRKPRYQWHLLPT
jgi:hypothetical protein